MSAERWLLTGASGQLGGHLLHLLADEADPPTILALSRSATEGSLAIEREVVDLRETERLQQIAARFEPTHILHAGAMTAVQDAYQAPQDAERINASATEALCSAARGCGARLLYTSTDMVFDGASAPYRETDTPRPLSVYGRTKRLGEEAVLATPGGVVVRLPLMFGLARTARQTTFANQLAALRAGRPLRLFTDEHRTPIWLVDAAEVCVRLGRSDATGIVHAPGPERLSRFAMIDVCARTLGIDAPQLEAISRTMIDSAEPRPADLSLMSDRLHGILPDLRLHTIAAGVRSD